MRLGTTALPEWIVVTYGDCREGKLLLIFHSHTDSGRVAKIFDQVVDV